MVAGESRVRAPLITDELRQAIVTGELPPGERLTEPALAQRFGVSRVPIREALRVLASEGFVEVRPYWGTRVAELPSSAATDLLELRGAVEPLAARKAAKRRTPEQLHAMEATLAAGTALIADGRLDELPALNGQFHLLLAEASGNRLLAETVQQLRAKTEWVYASRVDHRAGHSWDEHLAIVRAIRDRDEELAAALVAAHIRNASAALDPEPDSG
ncbi:GntR family transcriptional regulator [Cryptosporangium arvum]|uniref:Transcriptional regulator n=1 Tax=Cryptosporangium arvum DSM 44712 TaxID=927661 RepID=A0A010YHH7_9ACTN|nr:GntR family transcriptional regulator [Cryptosporangium arvum]EXG79725.1 transcriptional regulator [Cryptosporangium arvum DSM 44712]